MTAHYKFVTWLDNQNHRYNSDTFIRFQLWISHDFLWTVCLVKQVGKLIYTIKYAPSFVLFCSGSITSLYCIHMIPLPIFFKVASMVVEQSYYCPSASEVIIREMCWVDSQRTAKKHEQHAYFLAHIMKLGYMVQIKGIISTSWWENSPMSFGLTLWTMWYNELIFTWTKYHQHHKQSFLESKKDCSLPKFIALQAVTFILHCWAMGYIQPYDTNTWWWHTQVFILVTKLKLNPPGTSDWMSFHVPHV